MTISQNSVPQDDTTFNVDDIYTSLEDAREEIWRRWNDKALRAKVEEVLGGDIPEVFRDMPRAVLARHILSPNFEAFNFLEKAMSINLKPLCLEYLKDKFVGSNKDKYYLGRLFFDAGTGKRGGRKLSSVEKIIDFNKSEGRCFSEIRTIWGEDFITFHRNFSSTEISPNMETFDISEYYDRNGKVARCYYFYFLTLFVCYGVLFEDYLLSGLYRDFTMEVFLPTFKKVQQIFGYKPLIVRLTSPEQENFEYWRFYPDKTKKRVYALMEE